MIEFTDNTRAYTVSETAMILDYAPNTVRYLIRHGSLQGEKHGRRLYIHEEEIARFKDSKGIK